MIIDGIITKISKQNITIDTELGDTVVIPRYFGETPPVGAAVRIDFATSNPKIYSTPPIAKIDKVDRFLNFYAIPGESEPPPVTGDAATTTVVEQVSEYGPFVPYSFMDTPVGARTMVAGNGNISFAGPTAVGMATGCDTKIIAKHTGEIEFVTGHLVALQGRTVIVSSFRDNVSIEIDILNSPVEGGLDFTEVKKLIVEALEGTDDSTDASGETVPGKNPKTYEEAFDEHYQSFKQHPFLKMFGLHLSEILTKVQWERVKFRGNEKTFNEVFDGVAMFQSYKGYCTNCLENGEIIGMEFFIVQDDNNEEGVSVRVPQCEEQVVDQIYPMYATVNGEQYVVTSMTMDMKSGTKIEYVGKKRVYSLSHGIIAKKSFVSSDQQGVFSNKMHVDVDKISFSNLSFDNGVPDFCGNDTNLPAIYWNGDFLLSVSGSMTFGSEGNATIASSVQSIIAGGTRGIKIDSSGSTAITF